MSRHSAGTADLHLANHEHSATQGLKSNNQNTESKKAPDNISLVSCELVNILHYLKLLGTEFSVILSK